MKTHTAWMVFDPMGNTVISHTAYWAKESKKKAENSYECDWKELYSRGFRCKKIEFKVKE